MLPKTQHSTSAIQSPLFHTILVLNVDYVHNGPGNGGQAFDTGSQHWIPMTPGVWNMTQHRIATLHHSFEFSTIRSLCFWQIEWPREDIREFNWRRLRSL